MPSLQIRRRYIAAPNLSRAGALTSCLTSSWGSILEDEFADPISRKFSEFCDGYGSSGTLAIDTQQSHRQILAAAKRLSGD
jgi:hypothetical protein